MTSALLSSKERRYHPVVQRWLVALRRRFPHDYVSATMRESGPHDLRRRYTRVTGDANTEDPSTWVAEYVPTGLGWERLRFTWRYNWSYFVEDWDIAKTVRDLMRDAPTAERRREAARIRRRLNAVGEIMRRPPRRLL